MTRMRERPGSNRRSATWISFGKSVARTLPHPPAGATGGGRLDLYEAAKRYGELLAAGAQIGVIPQIEVWGFSENLSRLGEAVFVAIESGHADA